jgi:hypothetical protein
LLNRIEEHEDWIPEIAIDPEFVVRNSTARALAVPLATRSAAEDAPISFPIEAGP